MHTRRDMFTHSEQANEATIIRSRDARSAA